MQNNFCWGHILNVDHRSIIYEVAWKTNDAIESHILIYGWDNTWFIISLSPPDPFAPHLDWDELIKC